MMRTLVILACAVVGAACKKSEPLVVTTPAPVSAAPVARPPSVSLADRLAFEAAHRTEKSLKVEQVFAALSSAGMPVVDQKQFYAAMADARYCAGGRTADGISIAVCEYETSEAAEAGKRSVEQRFPSVPGRRITTRFHLTLTTTADPAPVSLAKVEAAFSNLKEGAP